MTAFEIAAIPELKAITSRDPVKDLTIRSKLMTVGLVIRE